MEYKDLLFINEVKDRYNIGRTRLYELFRQGKVTRVKLGKRVMVPKASLDEWLDDVRTAKREEINKRNALNHQRRSESLYGKRYPVW